MISGRDYGGKGSMQRPINNIEQFDKNWDSIFGKCDNEKKAMELMTIPTKWTHQGKIVEQLPDDCEGFVYLITNLANNRKYIGKKLARFKVTRPPLKGRTNKRRSTKESDWRDYWGSSEHLNADVISFGENKFTREILHYCSSRGILSYLESKRTI